MGKGSHMRKSDEFIQDKLIGLGIKILSGNYDTVKSKIAIEDSNGYKGIVTVESVIRGTKLQIVSKINPYSVHNIKLWLINNRRDFTLLSEVYNNNTDDLLFKCPVHGEFSLPWKKVAIGRGCKLCSRRNSKYSIDEISTILEEKGSSLIINSSELKEGIGSTINVTCEKHKYSFDVVARNLVESQNCCPRCIGESRMGENNNNYNPFLTEEDRVNKRCYTNNEYVDFKVGVFIRDRRTCILCGSKTKKIEAHHLDGYNWCKDKRLDIDNGVTLCKKCHSEFHSMYGKGNNTKKQFEQFKRYKLNKTS